MSIARVPLDLARRCLSLSSVLQRRAIDVSSSSRSFSSSEAESPAAAAADDDSTMVAADNLLHEAMAAVKGAKAEADAAAASAAADAPVPYHAFDETYDLKGVEYTGRANIDYTDAFIHYKCEVDMEKLRLEQPHPKVKEPPRI